jgi:hypothetical protein
LLAKFIKIKIILSSHFIGEPEHNTGIQLKLTLGIFKKTRKISRQVKRLSMQEVLQTSTSVIPENTGAPPL